MEDRVDYAWDVVCEGVYILGVHGHTRKVGAVCDGSIPTPRARNEMVARICFVSLLLGPGAKIIMGGRRPPYIP